MAHNLRLAHWLCHLDLFPSSTFRFEFEPSCRLDSGPRLRDTINRVSAQRKRKRRKPAENRHFLVPRTFVHRTFNAVPFRHTIPQSENGSRQFPKRSVGCRFYGPERRPAIKETPSALDTGQTLVKMGHSLNSAKVICEQEVLVRSMCILIW